jgi:Putative Ig domain
VKSLLYPACRRITCLAVVAVVYVGCLGGGSSGDDSSPPPTSNRAPTIAGSPDTSLVVNEDYEFRPSAFDPDGDALTFRARNLPAWASIESSTGRVNGTPGDADVGRFEDIRISVSDGQASDFLSPFSIDVNQFAPGNVTVSWLPPTTNADGTPISDLAGYRIYYGRSADELESVATVNNPGTTRRVIDNLSPATWFFAMTAVNGAGLESVRTQIGSITIS